MVKLIELNVLLGRIFQTMLPEPLRGKDITSHKLHIFDELTGKGVFNWDDKELTSNEVFIFKDSPPGTVGVTVKDLTESFFNDGLKEIKELETDPAFKLEVSDPDYRKTLYAVQTRIVKIFSDRRAKCNIIEIEEYETEMEDIAQDLESAYIYDFSVPPGKYTKILKSVRDHIATLNLAKTTKRYKTVIEFKDKIEKTIGSSFSIATGAAAFSAARKNWGRLPVLLGPVPLKHVDYVEVARSGKILKFRATGTVFLARQEGGADAIKIEGKMYKLEFITMFWLWALFIYGQSKFRDMEDIPNFLTSQAGDVLDIRKLNDIIMTDTSLEKPSYEFHQTFPFVNRHFIIPNCYIETISVEDKLPLKDILQYSILLRTYDKPKEVNWVGDKKGRTMFGFSNKTTWAKVCEYSLNFAWRMLNASGWMLDEQEWKIGSAMDEGVLDTYYDVDLTTIATMSYLNLMGIAT